MTGRRSDRPPAAAARILALVASLAACQGPAPRLDYSSLRFEDPDHELAYAVYAPPGFDGTESLPLVVFLHGAGDDEACFDEAGVGQHLDAEISGGRVPRAVIAIPRGDLGFWENWADGSHRYRDWVIRGLVPEVEARYGTRPCPEGCHLVGISMGGHGALRIAVLEPGRFQSVTVLSGPIFDHEAATAFLERGLLSWIVPGDRIWGPVERRDGRRDGRRKTEREDPFDHFSRPEDLGGLRLLLAWGERDRRHVVETNERFERHLREHGIPHASFVFAGGHDWKAWTPALDRVLATQIAPDEARP
jgi:enterochelin esterase-like enzyme